MFIPYLLLALLILITLALLTKVILETEYKDKKFFVVIKLGKFKIFDNSKKKEEKADKNDNKGEDKKESRSKFNISLLNKYTDILKQLFNDIKEIFRYFKRKVKAKEFKIDITFGMEDAAETGIATGMVWAFIGTVYPLVDTVIDIKNPVINVNPKFNCEYFNFEYKGIYKIKIFNILYIGIKGYKLYKKYKKLMNINGGA